MLREAIMAKKICLSTVQYLRAILPLPVNESKQIFHALDFISSSAGAMSAIRPDRSRGKFQKINKILP
jgi:hypothetical protein